MKAGQQSALAIAIGVSILWGCATPPTDDGLGAHCAIPDRLWDGQISLAAGSDIEAQMVLRFKNKQKTTTEEAVLGRARACNHGFCISGTGWLNKERDYCIEEGSSFYSEPYSWLDIQGPARGTLKNYRQVTACSVPKLDCPPRQDSIIGHILAGRATSVGEMCSHGHCISGRGSLQLTGEFCLEENARLYSEDGSIDIQGPLVGNLVRQSDCGTIRVP